MTKIDKRSRAYRIPGFFRTALNELSSPIYIGYCVSNVVDYWKEKLEIFMLLSTFFLELRCQWWWIYTINLTWSVFTVNFTFTLKFYFIFFIYHLEVSGFKGVCSWEVKVADLDSIDPWGVSVAEKLRLLTSIQLILEGCLWLRS
jgi:hypothetical protein